MKRGKSSFGWNNKGENKNLLLNNKFLCADVDKQVKGYTAYIYLWGKAKDCGCYGHIEDKNKVRHFNTAEDAMQAVNVLLGMRD